MPLSSDPKTLETSNGIIDTMKAAFGTPPGFRPAHAKGQLITGTFTPTSAASNLTTAHHFNTPSTPITVRFSSSTGIPKIPDTDPNANPRGIAVRFHLPNTPDGKRSHTDIIAHSTKYFPVRTGPEFLGLLHALGGGPEATGKFLSEHPETKRFVEDPKPFPVSLATQTYWAINAIGFVSPSGKTTYGRYRLIPVSGTHVLSEADVGTKDDNYLFSEINSRVTSEPVEFKLVVQLAKDEDVTNDATVLWPDDREVVELGTVKLEKPLGEQESLDEQKKVIFDPNPRTEGLLSSEDPLLDIRANIYLISGRQRREA
ncbi:catalase domain-containing protein [Aaosphaeria arxii CBS 175.79]|uniref:Catalase domain-containing protein n=1 Tax=Aaosphaeria arxii CBS 175.79 TaxID=1450172 RepID=A0A6A5YAY1_9PLEO|nr:catalase domain-containing protein [Aaosphaeria arxii CBS 175.79]KAF2022187.1 catalase domain-containing protein [Aaosphaeria arxii CBS 175.79]